MAGKIDKEQRARRKLMKILHELNQQVKKIYTSYVIFDNGIVMGKVVTDKDKKPKEKYLHGYYHSDNILESLPILTNSCLMADKVYVAFRDDKPEELYEKGGKLFLKGLNEEPWQIGFTMNSDMIIEAREKTKVVIDEVIDVLKNKNATMVLPDETVEKLIGYEKIFPKFFDKDEYVMHLTISEFPFLKNFKNCSIVMKDTNKDFFDVVYSTGNDKERYVMKRRFLKIKPLTKGE